MSYSRACISRFWDDVYQEMVKRRSYYINSDLGRYKQWEFLQMLNKWVDRPVLSALKTDSFEEAFGTDQIMDWIGQHSRIGVGIDISPKILAKAKGNSGSNGLYWVTSDITHMSFKDETFDLLFSSNTYGYLNNEAVREGLKEAFRILKPGGTFIISVSNRHNLLFKFLCQISFTIRKIPFPISKRYSLKDFSALLEEAGFCVQGHEPILYIPPFFNGIINFLNKTGHKGLCDKMISGLKAYSLSGNKIRYLTSFFLIFKACKKNDGINV